MRLILRGLLLVQPLPDTIIYDIKYIADKITKAVAKKITAEKMIKMYAACTSCRLQDKP